MCVSDLMYVMIAWRQVNTVSWHDCTDGQPRVVS